MSKYTEAFKRDVVKEYLQGREGAKSLGQRHGIDGGTVQEWIALYQAHGNKGLKKKYSHYSAKFKLSVLEHMKDNALSHRETVALFNIRNRGCLVQWEKRYLNGGIAALEPRKRGRRKSMPKTNPPLSSSKDNRTREELLSELNYLRMENDYLKKLKALVQAKQAKQKRK